MPGTSVAWRFSSETGFPRCSRFFDGHFPDNPIVPAAVILGFLAQRLEATGRQIKRVERMKFTRPLLPDVPFDVELTPRRLALRATFSDRDGVFAVATVTMTKDDV